MSRFMDTVMDVRSQPNPDLKVLGLLLVRYKSRTLLAREVVDGLPDLMQRLNTTVFETKIRETQKVDDSQAARMPLLEFSPTATAAQDYNSLIDELEKRGVL
jgi:chromosome partitioning protein